MNEVLKKTFYFMLLHLDIDILNIPSYTQLDLEFYFEKKR